MNQQSPTETVKSPTVIHTLSETKIRLGCWTTLGSILPETAREWIIFARLFAIVAFLQILNLSHNVAFGQLSLRLPRLASQPSAPKEAQPTHVRPAPSTHNLIDQIDQAVSDTRKRLLTANVHSPWQIFHGILALRKDFQLKLGAGTVNAIEWIATTEPQFDNQPLLLRTSHGAKFHPFTRKWAFEGHPAQFMALLGPSELPLAYKFKINGETVTIADFLNNIKMEVNSKEEVTWVLWALQQYLPPDAQWVNQHGEAWSIERLVQIETSLPVVGAACGGNHRLFALTRTRDKHLKAGGKLEGIWAQADLKIRQHIELARQLQNSDGSFSSKSYASPGITNDLNERFNTTGHTMEFLSIALPESRLDEHWVKSAVAMLSQDLTQNRHRQIDCGPLYHSLNSIMIYRDRVRARGQKELAPSIELKPLEPAIAKKEVDRTEITNRSNQVGVFLKPLPSPPLVKNPAEAASVASKTVANSSQEIAEKPSSTQTTEPEKPVVVEINTDELKSKLNAINPGSAITQLKPIEVGAKTTPSISTQQPISTPIANDQSPASGGNRVKTSLVTSEVNDELDVSDDESIEPIPGTLKPKFLNTPSSTRSLTAERKKKATSGTMRPTLVPDPDPDFDIEMKPELEKPVSALETEN